jgi:hypothetical protein
MGLQIDAASASRLSPGVMRNRTYISLILLATMLVAALGSLKAVLRPTAELTGQDAITQIEERLRADPDYYYTEYLNVSPLEQDYVDLPVLVNRPVLGTQVIIRGSNGIQVSKWKTRLNNLGIHLPKPFVRRVFPLRRHQHIEVWALEPTEEEMKELRAKVKSIHNPPRAVVEVFGYFPER